MAKRPRRPIASSASEARDAAASPVVEGGSLIEPSLEAQGRPVVAEAAAESQPVPATIRWDGSNMRSSYANVCNVSGTREEVVLMFGVNQAWGAGRREIAVQLSERIILSPFAAKRLAALLANVLREYEARFGEIQL